MKVSTMDSIHVGMLAILADIPAIGKSQLNKEQGYSFRGIDDVYAALHPLFVKHGVYVTPTLLDKEYVQEPRGRNQNVATDARVTVRYTFYAGDGSHIDIVVPGESRDFADKATNQAMSTAIKTALLQTFLIPVASDPDAVSPTITRTTPKPAPAVNVERPMPRIKPPPAPEYLIDGLDEPPIEPADLYQTDGLHEPAAKPPNPQLKVEPVAPARTVAQIVEYLPVASAPKPIWATYVAELVAACAAEHLDLDWKILAAGKGFNDLTSDELKQLATRAREILK